MAKQKFERTKPHVNIGTTATLTMARRRLRLRSQRLSRCRSPAKAQFTAYDMIDKAPEERARGITINTAHVEYQTDAPTTPTSTARATPTISKT
jgi:elongation factor Tu